MEQNIPQHDAIPRTETLSRNVHIYSDKRYLFLSESDLFSSAVREKVTSHFSTKKLSTKANAKMYLKTVLVMSLFVLLYFSSYASGISVGHYLLILGALGFTSSVIGFTIAHDAAHGAYSSFRGINAFMSESMSLIGGHVYNWKVLHNRIHHTYTGVVGADGDLHPVGALRFHNTDDQAKPYHRFQHFYAPLLYALTSLVWVFKKDFEHYFKTQHLLYVKPKNPRFEFLRLIFTKALYLFMVLGLPLLFAPVPAYAVILGFLCLHVIQGLVLALVFQLGHIVEGPNIISLGACSSRQKSWMTHQLMSTANFGTESRWLTYLTGGLNHQIEHHLFPNICHMHYPEISKIVRKLAAEHNIPYHEYKTFFAALKSHFRFLRECGAS